MKDQFFKQTFNSQAVRKAFLSNENVVHALQDLLEWDNDDNEFVQHKTHHTYNGYVLAHEAAKAMQIAELDSVCSMVYQDVENDRAPTVLQKYFENSCKVTDLFGTFADEEQNDLFDLANDPTDPSTLYADCSVEDSFVGFTYYFLQEFHEYYNPEIPPFAKNDMDLTRSLNASIMQEVKQEA